MGLVFTEYVRSLEPGRGPPLFAAVWGKLRSALIAEMKKRGLWTIQPGYLGIHGANSWWDGDALDELVADCYTFILRRLPSLRLQLKLKDNIEGLVFLCIRNFLHDLQRKHDPVGFRVFTVLRTAIRRLISAGTLYVLEGDPKVYNDTVVGFAPRRHPGRAPGAELERHLRGWSGELLPELVTGRGRKLDEVGERLATLVSQLPAHGIGAFGIKDLVDPLKRDVRASWNAIWEVQEGETGIEDNDQDFAVIVRLVRPDSGVEERDAFDKLLACVSEALERLEAPETTRDSLWKLWLFLRNHAAQSGRDKPPSQRRIAERLGIPRDRLPGLYATLGSWVEECRAASSGNRALSRDRMASNDGRMESS